MEQGRRSAWNDLSALIAVAWALDRRRVIIQLTLLLVTAVTGGVSLLLLVPIVNSIADPSGTISVGGVDFSLRGAPLPLLLAGFVALTLVSALVARISAVNSTVLQQEIVDTMRQSAFEAILAARWSFILQRRRSDIIEIVTVGASRCGFAYQQLVTSGVTALIALVTAAVALWVAPMVAAVSIVGVAILGAALATSMRPARRLGGQFGGESRKLHAVMIDSMDSLRLVRAHGADASWSRQLADAFVSTRSVQVANARRMATVSAFSSVGLAACASLLILVAVWAQVPPASILVILILVARLARNVQTLATNAATLANALPAVGDLVDLTQSAKAEREVPVVPDGAAGSFDLAANPTSPLVEFVNVAYTYPNSDNGVSGIDFVVPRGSITVLTGPSGGGKSTSADIALGLLAPDSGGVLVAGCPLEATDLPRWRSHVAYVPQETVLVPGSLRENLTWSTQRDVSDAECWRALDQAAASFAWGLSDGLDTMLGDRGVRLSGGERQRVAIARALLRKPALLVLDEATSSLDDDTEAAVIDLMEALTPEVTTLVIAHRQSTVAAAHHVVRIVDGVTVTQHIDVRIPGARATPSADRGLSAAAHPAEEP